MHRVLSVTVALLASIALGACTAGAAPSTSSAAPSVAAPSTASVAPSSAPSVAASPSAEACAASTLTLTTPGKLTIGTDNPAYPPYYQIPATGKATAPWELGDPTNGQGFESAFA